MVLCRRARARPHRSVAFVRAFVLAGPDGDQSGQDVQLEAEPLASAPGPLPARDPSARSQTIASRSEQADADWSRSVRRLESQAAASPRHVALQRLSGLVRLLARLAPRWSQAEGYLKLSGVPRDDLILDQSAGPRTFWPEGVEKTLDYGCLGDLLEIVHENAPPRKRSELEDTVRALGDNW